MCDFTRRMLPGRSRDAVHPYRAGYLADYRRDTEKRLQNGEVLGLVTTNAMELGVDVGGLDATVITGYPGTVSSVWQQAGRSGRAQTSALSVLVARDHPGRPVFYGGTRRFSSTSPTRVPVSQPPIGACWKTT